MKKLLTLSLLVFIFGACGSEFQKSPVDQLILELDDEPVYTIILYDMDVRGGFSKEYMHRYKVITENNEGSPEEMKTDWYKVTQAYFTNHQNDMGMEIAAKNRDGQISKVAAPPGYTNYVGNEQYGHWVQRDGDSFWEFYGKFAMMNTIFGLINPVPYGYYNMYRNNYYGRRAFYGSRDRYGRYDYGTGSNYYRNRSTTNRTTTTTKSSPNYFDRQQQKTGWKPSSSNTVNRTKTTTYRSRSGGYGK